MSTNAVAAQRSQIHSSGIQQVYFTLKTNCSDRPVPVGTDVCADLRQAKVHPRPPLGSLRNGRPAQDTPP